jgi:hypothetical protein
MATSRGPKGEADWIIMDPEINFGSIFGGFDTVLVAPNLPGHEAGPGNVREA